MEYTFKLFDKYNLSRYVWQYINDTIREVMMTIGYIKFGAGPEKVFILPDWFGGSAFFKSGTGYLDVGQFTYVVADYRGYGSSQDQDGEYTIAEMASDALELADSLGWEQFHLLCHSMSGKVAQLLAATKAERLKSAIALTPTPPIILPLDDDTWNLLVGCKDNLENRVMALNAATGGQYSDNAVRHLAEISMTMSNPDAYRGYLDAWAKTDITEELGQSDFPLKIIIGEKDPFVPEDAMRNTTMKAFPKAELVVLANIGHYPQLEAPLLATTMFETWFKKHS
jgi:pimeloyl-ACP methyl ester carboxylesterase